MLADRIDTERLALLPLRVEYAEEMARVLSDPELYVFTGGEPVTADCRIRGSVGVLAQLGDQLIGRR